MSFVSWVGVRRPEGGNISSKARNLIRDVWGNAGRRDFAVASIVFLDSLAYCVASMMSRNLLYSAVDAVGGWEVGLGDERDRIVPNGSM